MKTVSLFPKGKLSNISEKIIPEDKESKVNEECKCDLKQTLKKESEEEDETECQKIPLSEKMEQPCILKKIVIALSVTIIIICIGFVVYQFYTKRANQKIEICHQSKCEAYEKRLRDMSLHNDELVHENDSLMRKMDDIKKEYERELESVSSRTSNDKQVVYKTSKKSKKQIKHDIVSDEEFDEDDFAVEHVKFDDAPITKGKKKLNPQQALKTHINKGAREAYDKKQTAIQQQMENDREIEEECEREQIEIQKQLGLSREINDEKLIELANEQQQEEANHLEELDDGVVEIDQSLIA